MGSHSTAFATAKLPDSEFLLPDSYTVFQYLTTRFLTALRQKVIFMTPPAEGSSGACSASP